MAEFKESTYRALVEEIFTLFPSVQRDGFTPGAYKPGLEKMEAFLEALGHPENKFSSIHVAGTNGKGSVSSMLAAALSATGLRTGLYTSPHLIDFRERIRIGGEMVPKGYVFDFLTEWKPYFLRQRLSFFEITTGLCFKWFADSHVDAAVIEAGLGGRLDSTNVLEPDLSIVTNVGLDHCALLGSSVAEIAAEKAGIFKEGVPALVGETSPEASAAFEEKALMFCPLHYAEAQKPSLWSRHREILSRMDLKGPYQEKNLRTVLAAIDLLKGIPLYGGLTDTDAVIDALQHTAARSGLHGRWEQLSHLPYIIADIGHNPPALRCNFAALDQMLADGKCSSLILVYGIMADKNLDAILPLMPLDATFIFTTPQTPRALPAEDILKRWKAWRTGAGLGTDRAYTAETVRQAVQMAITLAQTLGEQTNRSASASKPVPPLIYIGGSTFVVGEASGLFRET